MKHIVLYTVILISIFVFLTFAEADFYLGIYKITIKNGWNSISLPMQTLQSGEGVITATAANTITDDTKSWTGDGFKNYILMIATGSGEGYYYKISSNTDKILTLSSSLSSSIVIGNSFYIYKGLTLTELFGDGDGPLYAAYNKNDADEIYLWDISTQAFGTPIWLCNTPGSEGWWQGATHITDNSVTLYPNQACFVVHKPSSEVQIKYVGVIPPTKQTIAISAGDTLAGASFPTSVTFSASTLQSVLMADTSAYTADNVFQWDYEQQNFGLPIWYSNYPGYIGWYRGSYSANGISIGPATGLFIVHKETETNWQRTKPYANP